MYKSLAELPFDAARRWPERISHKWRVKDGVEARSFADFAQEIRILTAGFAACGVRRGDHVGFFANNRFEWIATDFALQLLGAVSVPRGSDTAPREVAFIFRHSKSRHLIVESAAQLEPLMGELGEADWKSCAAVFVMDDSGEVPGALAGRTYDYAKLRRLGEQALAEGQLDLEALLGSLGRDDLMTIVYTSGTTGNPKGVMLSHGNFLQNVDANTPRLRIDPEANEKTVVMLPSWHVYERAFEYCAILTGVTLFYSSAGRFAADLKAEKPDLLISVPRVWESVHQKLVKAISEMPAAKRSLVMAFIKINQAWLSASLRLRGGYLCLHRRGGLSKALSWLHALILAILLWPGHLLAQAMFKPFRESVGGRLRLATCGAGSLPKYLDELFNAIGITLVNAYGMTECAPGILSRTLDRNTFGSTGVPFLNTEVELRREDGSPAGLGEKGVLFARGPQVMKGYWNNPEATAAVLSPDGWLNTGDLAVRSENGEFVIVGRMKDTIVLMGGENVEPEPIEDKLKESVYIDHAVVIGQDQKQLSAIVAVNEDELMRLAAELKLSPAEVAVEGSGSIENDEIYRVLLREVSALLTREHGFKPFERVTRILAVRNDFQVGRELTQTLKVKRKYVEERFRKLVERIHRDDRGN